MFQQTFLAKKPCIKSADLHPRQGNLLLRNNLQGSTKPLFKTQSSWRAAEKIPPFFQHASSGPKISMSHPRRIEQEQTFVLWLSASACKW
jgi:hypothetical protein